jgi:formate/nitrite transporter FocA (FNT family)
MKTFLKALAGGAVYAVGFYLMLWLIPGGSVDYEPLYALAGGLGFTNGLLARRW